MPYGNYAKRLNLLPNKTAGICISQFPPFTTSVFLEVFHRVSCPDFCKNNSFSLLQEVLGNQIQLEHQLSYRLVLSQLHGTCQVLIFQCRHSKKWIQNSICSLTEWIILIVLFCCFCFFFCISIRYLIFQQSLFTFTTVKIFLHITFSFDK